MDKFEITGGRVIFPDGIREAVVRVENGKIAYVGSECKGYDAIDAGGRYVSPGFIEMHIHGGGGYDFLDASAEAFDAIKAAHRSHGMTAVYATTAASSDEELYEFLAAFNEYKAAGDTFYEGIHLEAPYLNPEMAGAQDPAFIIPPSVEHCKGLLDASPYIRRVTIAPEMPGAFALGDFLAERGILPSIGHTKALMETVEEARRRGFTHFTHFVSAMTALPKVNGLRAAGAFEAGLYFDDMTVELIADGVHLPFGLLALVYKVKGPDRIALTTDAMSVAGLDVKSGKLGSRRHGQACIIEDGVAKLPNHTLAGSIATADRLARTMKKVGVPLHEIVRMLTLNTARIMGISYKKGSLEAGKDADIVIFDEDVRLSHSIVGGDIETYAV